MFIEQQKGQFGWNRKIQGWNSRRHDQKDDRVQIIQCKTIQLLLLQIQVYKKSSNDRKPIKVQLTLEQHRFELCESTCMWLFFQPNAD